MSEKIKEYSTPSTIAGIGQNQLQVAPSASNYNFKLIP